MMIRKIGKLHCRTKESGSEEEEEETLDYIFVATKNQFRFRTQFLDFQVVDFKTENGVSFSDHTSVSAKIKTKCT